MRFSCAVLLLALVYHIPWTLENPERSRLWLCPSVQNILRERAVQLVDVTFCAFGMAWKKPTWIVSVHLDLSILAGFFCKCSKRGICEYSGQWQASHSFVWSPSFRCLVYQDCWTISFQVVQKTGTWFSQDWIGGYRRKFFSAPAMTQAVNQKAPTLLRRASLRPFGETGWLKALPSLGLMVNI